MHISLYVSRFLFMIFLAIFLVIGISLIPLPGNYHIYTAHSGSMAPAIRTGSIILVKPQTVYRLNDIVTFHTTTPKQNVTHRIVEKKIINGRIVFLTKGDANKSKDSEPLYSENIIGRSFFSVPLAGFVIAFAKTLPGFIVLIVIPSTIIVYSELLSIKREFVRLINQRKQAKPVSKKK